MSDLTRNEAILRIETLIKQWDLYNDRIDSSDQALIDKQDIEALKFAFDSLKIDSTIKEAYDKGYKDGQEALAHHIELCKDEGSIIEIPEGATNGDMVKSIFPDAEVHDAEDYHCMIMNPCCDLESGDAWWNAPYRKEK